MIEAVLPVSDREKVRRNLDRLKLLIDSFNFFWTGKNPLLLHIVTPDVEMMEIKNSIESLGTMLNLRLEYKTESSISESLGAELPGRGNAKQMIIKLAAADFVQTPYFLLLDTDILACKPFDSSNLLFGSKAITEWCIPTLYQWWKESAKVLGYPLTNEELSRVRLHVTPQILSVDICKQLTNYIGERHSKNWIKALLDLYTGDIPNIWTEYTLYDLFADKHGLLEKYYIPHATTPKLHSRQSVWSAKQFETWDPSKALDQSEQGFFIVLQSITAHDVNFDEARRRWIDALTDHYPYFSALA